MPQSHGVQGADPFVFQGGVALGKMTPLRTTHPKCTEGGGGGEGEKIPDTSRLDP